MESDSQMDQVCHSPTALAALLQKHQSKLSTLADKIEHLQSTVETLTSRVSEMENPKTSAPARVLVPVLSEDDHVELALLARFYVYFQKCVIKALCAAERATYGYELDTMEFHLLSLELDSVQDETSPFYAKRPKIRASLLRVRAIWHQYLATNPKHMEVIDDLRLHHKDNTAWHLHLKRAQETAAEERQLNEKAVADLASDLVKTKWANRPGADNGTFGNMIFILVEIVSQGFAMELLGKRESLNQ